MSFESLLEWNTWWRDGGVDEDLRGVERRYTQNIIRQASLQHIKILAGVRRSGKSTILYQIIHKLIEDGVNPKNILYVNFEDENLLSLDFDKIIEAYLENLDVKGDIYLFLDEIQERKKWEYWVKKQYDLRKFRQIFISGSSSSLLLSEYARLLTGRALTFQIYPLSFSEFLNFRGFKVDVKLLSSREKAKTRRLFSEYLKYGGFPEVVFEKKRGYQILVEYYHSILEKDVITRYNLEGSKLRGLAKYLMTNISSLHSYKKLGSVANLSTTTVSEHLNHIENAFLLFQVPIFSHKIKDQLQYPRKIYSIDTGLRNAVSFRFSEDKGKLTENLVFIELKRRGREVFYWANGKSEVDFLMKDDLKVRELIQVCCDLNEEAKEREVKGVLAAMKEFKLKRGLILTWEYEQVEEVDGKTITYLPMWKWLLEEEEKHGKTKENA